jgi:hypothetical protein
MATATQMQTATEHNLQRQESTVRIEAALRFDKYIGLPYWPERNFVIDIAKSVHPKLADAKKLQARTAALEKVGKTMTDYEVALVRAARPFYTINDDNPDLGDGEIVIPARNFLSFVNHASMEAPKAIPRIGAKGLTFIGVRFFGPVDGFRTGLTMTDAKMFSRFVKMAESNQRVFSETPYVANFVAHATLTLDEEVIRAGDFRKLIEWGGKWIGIGGARPQGFGRFTVADWTVR